MSESVGASEGNELGTVESGFAEAGAEHASNVLAEAEEARFVEEFEIDGPEPEIFELGD